MPDSTISSLTVSYTHLHKGIADLHPVGGTGQFKVEVQPFFRAKLLRHRLTQQLIAPPGDPFRQRRQVTLVDLPADPGKNGRIMKGLPIAGFDGVQPAESAQNGAYIPRVAVPVSYTPLDVYKRQPPA